MKRGERKGKGRDKRIRERVTEERKGAEGKEEGIQKRGMKGERNGSGRETRTVHMQNT